MKQKYSIFGSKSAIDKLDLDELKSKMPGDIEITDIIPVDLFEDKDDKIYLIINHKQR